MSVNMSVMITGSYPIQQYARMATKIEEYGFDEIHVANDLIMRPAWPILTMMGEHTKRVKIGPAIVTPRMFAASGSSRCGVGVGGLSVYLHRIMPQDLH